MELSWQQGPLSLGAIGRFLVTGPLPKKLLYAEPLRRRMRVRFGGAWIAGSENVVLLFEPGHYPMAYFPKSDICAETLERTEQTTRHPELGLTSWYTVRVSEQSPGSTPPAEIMRASPTSLTRMATAGYCRNEATANCEAPLSPSSPYSRRLLRRETVSGKHPTQA